MWGRGDGIAGLAPLMGGELSPPAPRGILAFEYPERRMTFREVYHDHFAFVWRSLRRLGVPDADANDAAQDVFLVVHRRLGDFEGRAKLTTWLFRICLRVARDRAQRAHVRYEVPAADGTTDRVDPEDDAVTRLERRDDLALFDAAISELDFDLRAAFSLFELEAMTGPEVAHVLQVPLGTAYSRLRLAREAFRKAVARLSAEHRLRASVAQEGAAR